MSTRKADCMSPIPVNRDADSHLEDTPSKELTAALNRPIPSKFDSTKRITRAQNSNEKAKESTSRSPRRSKRRVTFSDLQKLSKEEADQYIEDEALRPSKSCHQDALQRKALLEKQKADRKAK